jgi:hypothetical protein
MIRQESLVDAVKAGMPSKSRKEGGAIVNVRCRDWGEVEIRYIGVLVVDVKGSLLW